MSGAHDSKGRDQSASSPPVAELVRTIERLLDALDHARAELVSAGLTASVAYGFVDDALRSGRSTISWRCPVCGMDTSDPEHRAWACEAVLS